MPNPRLKSDVQNSFADFARSLAEMFGSKEMKATSHLIVYAAFLLALNTNAQECDIDPTAYYNQFLKGSPAERTINILPTETTDVLQPPEGWTAVAIDSVSLQLPFQRFKSASMCKNSLLLREDDFVVALSGLGPMGEGLPYPPISFDQMCSIYRISTKNFVSAKTKDEKKEVLSLMVIKSIGGENLKDLAIVDAEKLKATIVRHEKPETKSYTTFVDVWNCSGTIHFQIMVANEPSREFPLQILGGIKFTAEKVSPESVSADLHRICTKLEMKEPNHCIDTDSE